jgi:predicted nucleotidyltransferase
VFNLSIACYSTSTINLSRPHTALGDHVTNEVLVALARTTRPLNGRELARLIGRSDQRVREILHDLVEQGVVDVQEAGTALLYTLNRDHVAAPAIETLANLRREFERRVRAAIQSWPLQPVHVSIFGSAARGDGDITSDIDLFIVRPNDVDEESASWREQIEHLSADVYRWSGNRAGVNEVSESELARLRRTEPPIVNDLRSEAITLVGPRSDELFKERR